MRFELSPRFKSDYKQLSPGERDLFKSSVRNFNVACDKFVESRGNHTWPSSVRVKLVSGTSGVFEMTWNFSGPDGRATWEWTTVTDASGETVPAIRWRRLGGHAIFKSP